MKNFKKVLALVLVLATLMGLATVAGAATEYKDADKINADYTEAIKVLDLIETMQGYPTGEFKPTATITREEAAKVIAIFDNKDADISTYYTSINPFADEKGRWGESYVGYGYRAGIIAGMNATTYAPTANVTGTQFLKMTLVTLGYDQEKEGFVGASWAVNVLALAKRIGLVDNMADGWKPEKELTREEAAQILLNALNSDMVEYGQEVKAFINSDSFKNDIDTKGYFRFNGKLYLTVAGAVSTAKKLYTDFGVKKEDSTDAFYRPYTKWTLGKESVEVMKAPKATFTKKFSACDLLVALGVKESDTKTQIIIDEVYCDGDEDHSLDHALLTEGEEYNFYWNAEDEADDIEETATAWSHSTSTCDAKDAKHGAQGTLTQVFYNGEDTDGNKHYTVTSIETWLGKVTKVSEKATARDEHLKSEGAVELVGYFHSEQTLNENNDGYCETERKVFTGHCSVVEAVEEADDVLTFDDPTGLKKDDYVLFTFSFRKYDDKGKDYTEGGVQSVDVTEGKDGRLSGHKFGVSAGSDPSETRIGTEYVKDSQHFHLGYDESKSNEYGTYTFFYDVYGNVIGMKDASDSSNWGVIDLAYITYEKGTAQLNAEIVDLDAKTTANIIKKFDDIYDVYEKAAEMDDVSKVTDKNFAYDLAQALYAYTNGEAKEDFDVLYDHLFKVSTDKDGKFTVKVGVDKNNVSLVDAYGVHPTAVDDTTDLSDETITVTNGKPYLTLNENINTDGVAKDTDIVLTSNTKFLVHKMDGTYVAYTGYKNVPSMIAHYAEVVYDSDYKDQFVAEVVYLTNDVYMTNDKVTAYVGKGADRSNIEVVEDGDTYYNLTAWINGEETNVYVSEEDMKEYFDAKTDSFEAGFYQLQYTTVDDVTTVKVLKALDDFDEFLDEPVAADYFNGTVIKIDGKTYALADDCGLFGIYKNKVESVKASEIESLYDDVTGDTHKVYVELNDKDEVTAIYIILANND